VEVDPWPTALRKSTPSSIMNLAPQRRTPRRPGSAERD
jgi:hypothetical protein